MDESRRLGESGCRGMRATFLHWAWRVEPRERELLSSFLTRMAWRHGSSPTRFCDLHFPGISVWNRDIDRSAPVGLIRAVAAKADLPADRIGRMTLRAAERRLSRSAGTGVSSWINPIGVYHRLRRLHGLQYCPRCLADQGSYDKTWRLTFVTVCPVHRLRLHDGCPHCDAPVLPHRQLPHALRCHACHLSISQVPSEREAPSYAVGTFQESCLSVLECGTAWVGDQRIGGAAYFLGLRMIASAYLQASGSLSAASNRGSGRNSLERSRVAVRHEQIGAFFSLLDNWPEAFLAFAREQHWTQRAFARGPSPKWLSKIVRTLPAGHTRSTGRRNSLRLQLEALGRWKTMGWRSKRAALLCAAMPTERP